MFRFDLSWIKKPERPKGDLVLYFDGFCGLCNGVVDFVMSVDTEQRFKFSPLQSEYAAKHLTPRQTQDLESFVITDDGHVLEASDAVIRMGRHLGGLYGLAALGAQVLPRGVRDAGYRLIARNRYKWFGKKDSCRIPSPSERQRFLV